MTTALSKLSRATGLPTVSPLAPLLADLSRVIDATAGKAGASAAVMTGNPAAPRLSDYHAALSALKVTGAGRCIKLAQIAPALTAAFGESWRKLIPDLGAHPISARSQLASALLANASTVKIFLGPAAATPPRVDKTDARGQQAPARSAARTTSILSHRLTTAARASGAEPGAGTPPAPVDPFAALVAAIDRATKSAIAAPDEATADAAVSEICAARASIDDAALAAAPHGCRSFLVWLDRSLELAAKDRVPYAANRLLGSIARARASLLPTPSK